MATSITVRYVCDLPHDEGLVEAAVTGVTIRHGRRTVEVDLCQQHASLALAALEHGARPSSPLNARQADRPAPAAVRAWARSRGVHIAPRGRVPAAVTEAYLAATA